MLNDDNDEKNGWLGILAFLGIVHLFKAEKTLLKIMGSLLILSLALYLLELFVKAVYCCLVFLWSHLFLILILLGFTLIIYVLNRSTQSKKSSSSNNNM